MAEQIANSTTNYTETPIAAADFERMSAEERLAAVDRHYGDGALMLTSLQKPSGVLMHMIHRLKLSTYILFVDTQFHFQETLDLRDEFAKRLNLEIHTAYPELNPEEQEKKYGCLLYNFVDGQPTCCNLRKEEPFLRVAGERKVKALISSLMRAEDGKRKNIKPIAWDARLSCPVYHPIYDWTEEQLEEYTRANDVPVHALYAKGYPSIGCWPCTTPIYPGEDKRAGRWRHLRQADGSQPQYCNINFGDGGGI